MVTPYDGRKEGDCQNGRDHGPVSEYGFSGVGGQNFRYDTKRGQDDNVYFGVAEEPEQVLEQYRRTSLVMQNFSLDKNIGQEERSTKTSVHDKH